VARTSLSRFYCNSASKKIPKQGPKSATSADNDWVEDEGPFGAVKEFFRKHHGKPWLSYTYAGLLALTAKLSYDSVFTYTNYRLAHEPFHEVVMWNHVGDRLMTYTFQNNEELKAR